MATRARAPKSGPETGRLNQAHLIATGREFTTLIALHNNATTGLNANDASANPTQSSGFEHLHHVTGLQIQLHVRNHETSGGDIERAVEDLNPRHQVLETCVLPTELTAQGRCPRKK